MRGVRPLEWALLGFSAFALFRGGLRVIVAWQDLGAVALLGMGLVGVVDLAWHVRRLPWPVGTIAMRRLLATTFPIALVPTAVAAVVMAETSSLARQIEEAHAAEAIPLLLTMFLYVLGAGLPTVVLWLALAVHVKRVGQLDGWRFVRESAQGLRTTLREWLPLSIALSAYGWMGPVIGDGPDRDAWMQAADRVLFLGNDPLDLLQRVIWAPLSVWLAFAYALYILMFPLVIGAVVLFGGRRGIREVGFLIGGAMLVSYVSYALIPVKGPLLTRSFDVSLELYLIGPLKEAMMDKTRIAYDCFPSMHTCCSMLMGWAAWRYARRLFWVLLPVIVSMPLACVYLRYHYVVDVLAGLAFAPLMIWLTVRLRGVLWRDLPEASTVPVA